MQQLATQSLEQAMRDAELAYAICEQRRKLALCDDNVMDDLEAAVEARSRALKAELVSKGHNLKALRELLS